MNELQVSLLHGRIMSSNRIISMYKRTVNDIKENKPWMPECIIKDCQEKIREHEQNLKTLTNAL